MADLVQVTEFQTYLPHGEPQWESLIRFALINDAVEVIAHDDPATQAEVEALLAGIYDETLYLPGDGHRFFRTICRWKGDTPYARVTAPTLMSIEEARDKSLLVSVHQDAPAADGVELLGRSQTGVPAKT